MLLIGATLPRHTWSIKRSLTRFFTVLAVEKFDRFKSYGRLRLSLWSAATRSRLRTGSGVDLFFVISGFIIARASGTGARWSSCEGPRQRDLPTLFARRFPHTCCGIWSNRTRIGGGCSQPDTLAGLGRRVSGAVPARRWSLYL